MRNALLLALSLAIAACTAVSRPHLHADELFAVALSPANFYLRSAFGVHA
jgi:hypothetical protein